MLFHVNTIYRIGYTPDVLTDATADLTLSLILATSRKVYLKKKKYDALT